MSGNSRIVYVDHMKAWGMLTIIWGHIMLFGITNSMAYAFHIPLFFFLSGLMFKKAKYPSFLQFVSKRIKSLLVPYVIFSFVTWIIWAAYVYFSHADVESYINPLLQTVVAQGSGGFLIHNVPLWFVTCLFVVEIMYFFIAKLSVIPKIFVCVLSGVCGSWMTLDNGIFDFTLLPWNIEVALAAIPFYALGNFLIERYSHEQLVSTVLNHKVNASIVFVIAFILLYLGADYNGHVSMGSNHLNNFIVFYSTAIFGILAMFIFCVFMGNLKKSFFTNFIEWFGRNSFTAMAIHNPIKGIVVVIVTKLLSRKLVVITEINEYQIAIIAFLISLIITCIGIVFVNKIKSLSKS